MLDYGKGSSTQKHHMTYTFSLFRIIMLCFVLSLGALALFILQYQLSVTSYQSKVYEQVTQRSQTLAIKQREIVRAKMFELDRVLLTLRDAISNPLFLEAYVNQLMLFKINYYTELADFLVLDTEGKITNWTREEPVPIVTDRDYFQWHLKNDSDKVFKSSVQTARVENPFVFFALSRKIISKDGDFLGVVVATVNIAKLATTLDDQLFDGQLTHVLADDQLKIIYRLPWSPEFINSQLTSFDQYDNEVPDYDSFTVLSPFDAVPRLVTFQQVPDWPLTVFVGEDLTTANRQIDTFKQMELNRWSSITLILTLLIISVIWLLKRKVDNASEIDSQRKKIEDFHHRNRAILEAMPDLVFTLDESGKILDYQSGQKDLLFAPPESFLNKSFYEIMPDGIAKQGFTLFQRVINTGEPQQFEYPLEIRDQQYYFELRMSKIDDRHILAIARNITDRKKSEEMLTWQARHDSLTGLPNRLMFYEELQKAVNATVTNGTPFALLYLDINGFKPVNDNLGHYIGDLLLTAFAKRVKASVNQTDLVARLAGDEFAVICQPCKTEQEAYLIMNQLKEKLGYPFGIENHQISISASIGHVWTNEWKKTLDDLVHQADQRMYTDKANYKKENKLI